MIDLVTSMNKKLYDTYGKHNLKTFNQNLSDELRLNIFFEGEIPEDFHFNRLHVLLLKALINALISVGFFILVHLITIKRK